MICIKKISCISCILLVLIGFSSPLKAISGAELAYECLGVNQYRLTLQVYRDCSAPTLPTSQTLQYNSVLCGAGATLTATLDSSYEVSGVQTNQQALTTCNGGTIPGIQVFIYSATLTFPQTCQDWVVSWLGCCRSANITNLSTSGSNIYVEAGIDSRYQYSSPSFKRNKLPYYFANSSYDNQLKAPTGYPGNMDSFVVALTCPLQAANSCLSHGAGLSASHPLLMAPSTGMTIANYRKELRFKAQDSVAQIAAVAMTIHQMKNGDTVGYVQSDFPVIVLDSTALYHAPLQYTDPVFNTAGIVLSPHVYYNQEACGGQSIIFSIVVYDEEGDTITLDPVNTNLDQVLGAGNWTIIGNSNPPFRPDSVQYFVQIASNGIAGLNPFYNENAKEAFRLSFSDGRSPIPSCLTVDLTAAFHTISIQGPDTICPFFAQTIPLTSILQSNNGGGNYVWRQLSGPPAVFSSTSTANTFLSVPAAAQGDIIEVELQVTTLPDSITGTVCILTDVIRIHYDNASTACNNGSYYLVEGKVLIDNNQNCVPDSTEPRFLPDCILLFENGQDSFYAVTNGQQQYQIFLDTGTYTVSLVTNHSYWSACPPSQTLTIDTALNTQVLDWSIDALFFCPNLNINLRASANLRPCLSRRVWVHYENDGTVPATNVYADIDLEDFLTISNSSTPFTNLGNDQYRFNLDSLDIGERGSFYMDIYTACSVPINASYTIKAHIYPDSSCTTQLPRLVIEDSCAVDTVLFQVTNYANATPIMPYWILENRIVVDTGSIQLGLGQSLQISYPADSNKSYQLVINPSNPTYAASEHIHCLVDSNFIDSRGLFIPYNNLAYLDVFHANVVNSYDPNIKVAQPVGYGAAHYILPNQAIDYTIHFQNTGTDTAYLVRLVDTLSIHVDVASLSMRGSSHPYTWQIHTDSTTGKSVLEFIFNGINLVDSTTNEPASHGFVEYTIQQHPNLVNYTSIENQASIYFDFNAPIHTNTTLHTVCDTCYGIAITQQSLITASYMLKEKEEKSVIRVYPNPTTGWLTIEQKEAQSLQVQVYTISGVLVKTLSIQDNLSQVDLSSLGTGVYWLQTIGTVSSQVFKIIKS